jgi:hypothetical protein
MVFTGVTVQNAASSVTGPVNAHATKYIVESRGANTSVPIFMCKPPRQYLTPGEAAIAAHAALESFASYAARARGETLKELKEADLANWQRVVVYSSGAGEGFLLDRLNPKW